jgi:diguanylate cyclase (GGDEF)-like protein/PAS domain S-box-containing protein
MSTAKADNSPLFRLYLWAIAALGAAACVACARRLSPGQLDFYYLGLTLVTLGFGSRINIKIPRANGWVSISDTFIFLALWAYGGEAATLLATLEGFCSSLRHNKKTATHFYNAAVMACSTFVTAWALQLCFGAVTELPRGGFSGRFAAAICLSALAQYTANLGVVALGEALRRGQSVFKTWREGYLYTSVAYFAAAATAGLVVKLAGAVGFYAFLVTLPIIAVVYFTYRTYLEKVEAQTAQIAQSARHMAELRESEARFRSAFDYASVGMALVEPAGRFVEVNRSLSEITGYAEAELLARDFQSLTHPDDLGRSLVQVHQVLAGQASNFQLEKRYVHKEGRSVWVHWSVSQVCDVGSKTTRLIFQVQDITDRKRAEEQLLHDAFHDCLTGLPNRALFLDHLKLAIERAKRHPARRFAVLFLDLDRFKIVNDGLGHTVGDRLLVETARRLEACLRPGDTVARLGGDEFTILLEDLKDQHEAMCVAERVQRELAAPFNLNGQEVFTSASVGIAYSSLEYEEPEEILRDADTAMYRAKAAGHDRYQVFNQEMHSEARGRLRMETDLRRALERQEFALVYQPIVALGDGRLTGFEALIRWQHPELGFVSPVKFIPVAEETGLIVEIGQWVLEEACRRMREWVGEWPSDEPLQMSVNLSSRQFARPDFIGQVRNALAAAKLDARYLKLEITESVVMENIETATSLFREIRALGIDLSIDDFGTGYSSLSYLHRFPINTMKVDRSFVMQMHQRENAEIVRTIVMLADTLRMDVVAEGVETCEQLRQLKALGCAYGQGYYFSKPVDARAAGEMVRQGRRWDVGDAHAHAGDEAADGATGGEESERVMVM